MLDDRIWWVILLRKAASKRIAHGILARGAHGNRRTMMPVNTKLKLAVLAVETGVQTGEVGDGFQVFVSSFVLVLEAAFIAFGAGTPQVVVVAEFVIRGAAFYLVENGGVDGYWGVETTGARHPGWFGDWGDGRLLCCAVGFDWNWRDGDGCWWRRSYGGYSGPG